MLIGLKPFFKDRLITKIKKVSPTLRIVYQIIIIYILNEEGIKTNAF